MCLNKVISLSLWWKLLQISLHVSHYTLYIASKRDIHPQLNCNAHIAAPQRAHDSDHIAGF